MDMMEEYWGQGGGSFDGYWKEKPRKVRRFQKKRTLRPGRRTAYGAKMEWGEYYYQEKITNEWYSQTELAAEKLQEDATFEIIEK